jgi:hypothetical protein
MATSVERGDRDRLPLTRGDRPTMVSDRKHSETRRGADGCGTARSTDRTRYNRMTWGVMIHDILPSKGTKCVYRSACRHIRQYGGRHECRHGGRCPAELALYWWIVAKARRSYEHMREPLGDAVFEQTVHDFAILWLRKERLSARIGIEGFLRESVNSRGYREASLALGFGRYQTAIEREFADVIARLVGADNLASG